MARYIFQVMCSSPGRKRDSERFHRVIDRWVVRNTVRRERKSEIRRLGIDYSSFVFLMVCDTIFSVTPCISRRLVMRAEMDIL